MRAREDAVRDDANDGPRAAMADSLWELWDGDYVDPELDAGRLLGILKRRGWELRRAS